MSNDYAAEVLEPLRTQFTTDDQWLALMVLIDGDQQEGQTGWTVGFPDTEGGSVRVVCPDGTARVLRADGEVWSSEDIG